VLVAGAQDGFSCEEGWQVIAWGKRHFQGKERGTDEFESSEKAI